MVAIRRLGKDVTAIILFMRTATQLSRRPNHLDGGLRPINCALILFSYLWFLAWLLVPWPEERCSTRVIGAVFVPLLLFVGALVLVIGVIHRKRK